jgi:hypothetical protein
MPPPKKISSRQRVLAQWRGVDLEPIETAKAVRARDAGKIVSKVLADLKMDSRRAEIEIVKVWNSLLDPNITAHAQPANLHKGTLFVNVDSSAWLSEIGEKFHPENFLPRGLKFSAHQFHLLRCQQPNELCGGTGAQCFNLQFAQAALFEINRHVFAAGNEQ